MSSFHSLVFVEVFEVLEKEVCFAYANNNICKALKFSEKLLFRMKSYTCIRYEVKMNFVKESGMR